MASDKIELVLKQAIVRLVSDKNDWCRVELLENGRVHKLGADLKTIVVERLRRGLIDALSGTVSEHIPGVKSIHVLSLAENHCSIYAADINDNRCWFIQGANARIITHIQISPPERKKWLEILVRSKNSNGPLRGDKSGDEESGKNGSSGDKFRGHL